MADILGTGLDRCLSAPPTPAAIATAVATSHAAAAAFPPPPTRSTAAAKQAAAVAALRRRRAAAVASGTFGAAYDTVVPPSAGRRGRRAAAAKAAPAAGPPRRARRAASPPPPPPRRRPDRPVESPRPAHVEPLLLTSKAPLPTASAATSTGELVLDALPSSPLSSSAETSESSPRPPLPPPPPPAPATAGGEALPRSHPSLVLCPPTQWSLGAEGGCYGKSADVARPVFVSVAPVADASPSAQLGSAVVATSAVGLPRGGGFMVPDARRWAPASPPPPPPEAHPPTLPPAASAKSEAPAASAKAEAPSVSAKAKAPAVTPRAALSSTLPTICSSTPTEWDDLIDESAVKVTHVSDEEDLNPTEAARYRSMLAANAQVLPSGLALMDSLPRNLSFRPPPRDAARSPVAATASSDDSSSNGRRQLPRGVPLRPVNRRRRQTVGGGAPVRGPPPRGAAGSATASSVPAAARAAGSGHTVRFASNGNDGATYAAALASVDGGSLCTLSDDDDAPPTPVAVRSAGLPASRRVGGDGDGVPLDGLVTPRPSLAVFASRRLAVRLLHGAVVREEGAGGAASGERRGGRFGRALRRLSLRA